MIGIVYLLIFLVTTGMTLWLNFKFIADSSGIDQYWHIVQLYQQIWVWIGYGIIVIVNGGNIGLYVWNAIGYGLCYMFIYNSYLSISRHYKITHVSRYDITSFFNILILFIIGVLLLLYINIFVY